MDIVRLRTLTRKSKIGWGMFKDCTVQELLDTRKGQISWLYYHVEWMTFTDDVLEEAHIWEDRRIEKPGTNPGMYDEIVRKCMFGKHGSKAKFIISARERKKAKKLLKMAEEDMNLSKKALQAINHGHRRSKEF